MRYKDTGFTVVISTWYAINSITLMLKIEVEPFISSLTGFLELLSPLGFL